MSPTTDTGAAKVYTEVLPLRSGKRAALRWYPLSGDTPQAGFVVIETARDRTAYSITEFCTGWPGRGFYLAKHVSKSGTDKTAEGYSCFASMHGAEGDSCDCRGFTRWGWCKHSDSVRSLILNGWL